LTNDRAKLLSALRRGVLIQCPGCREQLGALNCGHCGYSFEWRATRKTAAMARAAGAALSTIANPTGGLSDPAIARITRLAWMMRQWFAKRRFSSKEFLDRFPGISTTSFRRDLYTLVCAGFTYKVEDKSPRLPTAYVFTGFDDDAVDEKKLERRLRAVS
jgi:hypothetical protein